MCPNVLTCDKCDGPCLRTRLYSEAETGPGDAVLTLLSCFESF